MGGGGGYKLQKYFIFKTEDLDWDCQTDRQRATVLNGNNQFLNGILCGILYVVTFVLFFCAKHMLFT